MDHPVDDQPRQVWFGTVLPKRHARRAVTRNLVRRTAMAEAVRRGEVLPPGLWILRLRQAFDLAQFPSAASPALQSAVRDELVALFGHVARQPA